MASRYALVSSSAEYSFASSALRASAIVSVAKFMISCERRLASQRSCCRPSPARPPEVSLYISRFHVIHHQHASRFLTLSLLVVSLSNHSLSELFQQTPKSPEFLSPVFPFPHPKPPAAQVSQVPQYPPCLPYPHTIPRCSALLNRLLGVFFDPSLQRSEIHVFCRDRKHCLFYCLVRSHKFVAIDVQKIRSCHKSRTFISINKNMIIRDCF